MLHQLRFVMVSLGVLSGMLSVRSSFAQSLLRVESVAVRGEFASSARCPGNEDIPDALIVTHTDLSPLAASLVASTSGQNCLSRGRAAMNATFLEMGNGTLQLTGSASVSTFGSVAEGSGDPFAVGAASADTSVTVTLRITRWSNLSFVGTLSVGTVTAVGAPDLSSVNLVQSWELLDSNDQSIVQRSIELSSNDADSRRQDTNYSTVVARPGLYRLRITLDGDAQGDIREPGATGWTCAGTYGLAISASPACMADFDLNGVLDSADFFEFLNAYFLEAADFNQDAIVNSQDLFDFISAFLQGC